MPAIHELLATRAKNLDRMTALAEPENVTPAQEREFYRLKAEIESIDKQVDRAKSLESAQAKLARPIGSGSMASGAWAAPKTDPYEADPSLSLAGMLRMVAASKGNISAACETAIAQYGESHPVAKAMAMSKAQSTLTGAAGGFAVPPDFSDAMIPLLYAKTVVRKAGALVMPMPNGTMSIPKMTAGATAVWLGEGQPIGESGPTWGQVTASAKKLAALVPVTNDLMRYASPQLDEMLRNDLVTQIALAEDAAFIRGAGTTYMPRGLKSFVLAGQTITSTYAYSLTTVNNELAGLINKLESANLPLTKVGWLMNPRTKNYLLNLLNSQGFYVYRDEMVRGTLLGYPFYTTTQIPINLTVDANSGCSEIYLVDFGEVMILESRQMELAVSMEGVYKDANGNLQSAFQQDMTLVRAILAEDFQVRHDEAIAFNQGVAWSPALS